MSGTGKEKDRQFVPPLGWPIKFRAVTVACADRPKRLVTFNRYPRQIIGVAIRLPDIDHTATGRVLHPALSVLWAKPARWWTK